MLPNVLAAGIADAATAHYINMSNQRRGRMSTTPLLRITVFDPGGFQKASSAAAYSVKCAELALAQLSQNHGTLLASDVVGQTPDGRTNQVVAEFFLTPGKNLPP
jgi:hypothetical protein